MATPALYDYNFPSRSAQELYGDDILVNMVQTDDMWFRSGATVRVPKAMTWGDFYQTQFLPYVSANPHTKAGQAYSFQLQDVDFTAKDEQTLDELGVGHKHTFTFANA
ncbi:hypothetical protein [Granulicoccus phenolivorans]|uniref:hypothetical protein n=1 Tax=Granulicoccus phenolivorans TaxID=266854 RepID=UPI0004152888|nr:hypothetical protein [Granulicoccus phenolivorans]